MTAPRIALREVVEAKTGTMNPSAWPDDPITYVDVTAVDNRTKAIAGARTLRGAEAPGRARRLLRTGDVLVSTVRPNLNAVALVPESLDGDVASTAFCVLRATPRVLPEYLYFFVQSGHFIRQLDKLAKGALYPAVSDSCVLDQMIPLPPLEKQRGIVDMLLCARRALRQRREIRERTAQLLPALYGDAFGDSVSNPKGWPVVPLESLLKASPQNGLYKHRSAYGEGTPIVRIDSFNEGEMCEPARLKRLRLDDGEAQRYVLAEGDILVNRVNSTDHLGKSVLIRTLPEATVFESNMMRLVVDPERALSQYVFSALQTTRTRRHFQLNAKRAINQASLNQQDLKALPVMLPPLAKQASFARYADTAASARATEAQLTSTAEATLASLLAKVFG
ncbi:type I restriction enzyme, S subunit [Variovorax sp. HW608]|uniref:restriction endonuclease subunit S n=1 Tax=Variovorax sp. HW608 TaxID=1034889 RepID=UPI00081FB8D0|nr:restriction endonuclease subunit S [Variovorax sp. HW608]SCK50654.1 type I restriction enzyme, S subunit [Variovorax sp. HW608]